MAGGKGEKGMRAKGAEEGRDSAWESQIIPIVFFTFDSGAKSLLLLGRGPLITDLSLLTCLAIFTFSVSFIAAR